MSDRIDFCRTWLFESPMGSGLFPTYDGLCYAITGLSNDHTVVHVSNNLRKIEVGNLIFYWYVDANENILLGSELYVRPQGLVVSITGKNSAIKGQPPFASNLYVDIINDTQRAIRLLSDDSLSDEGFNVWKRLYNDGLCISVYDKSEKMAGQSYKKLNTYQDFESFYKIGDPTYKNYQYVLAKTKSPALAETFAFFNLRRMRELAGLDLEDYDPTWRNNE